MHLYIGQAYATSVYKTPLVEHFGTSLTPIGIVFSIAIVMLGLSAAVFGTLDGRSAARDGGGHFLVGGFLVGAAGITTEQLWLLYLGHGVIGGISLGIGYISPVSTLIKWFPDRPGLATGMAIMGFGGGPTARDNEPVQGLDYDVVDVFTDRPYAGNPLAVVHGTDGLATAQLQALALEFNLSETTFPTVRAGGSAYDVRIFTTAEELPFAGHPTLGTAWLLRRQDRLERDDVVQHCGAGEVPVHVDTDRAELIARPRYAHQRDDSDALAAAVGLDSSDVEGPAYEASSGLGWVFLRVRADAVERARVPVSGWSVQPVGSDVVGGVSVWSSVPGDPLAVHARVFCPDVGVTEDPATGSAAAALGLVLAADGSAARDGETAFRIAQGAEIGRASTLHGRVEVADGTAVRVRVGGGVTHVAAGRIAVPPG